jgi:hypothetical protein
MRIGLRRSVLLGAPLFGYLVGMLHPTRLRLDQSPWLYISVHLVIPILIGLLAWMIVLLVEGIDNRAATAARLLVVPFALVYSLFTAFAGLAYGVMVWKAGGLPAEEQPGAVALIHDVFHNGLERAIYIAAGLLWLAAMVATAVALRDRVPIPALALLTIGATIFANSHERPWGPAGMAAILAGIVWLEFRPNTVRTGR